MLVSGRVSVRTEREIFKRTQPAQIRVRTWKSQQSVRTRGLAKILAFFYPWLPIIFFCPVTKNAQKSHQQTNNLDIQKIHHLEKKNSRSQKNNNLNISQTNTHLSGRKTHPPGDAGVFGSDFFAAPFFRRAKNPRHRTALMP